MLRFLVLAFVCLAVLPVRAQDLPSAVVFHELLEATVVDLEDGRFNLGYFVIAFPDGDEAKVILRNAEGVAVWTRAYQGQRDGTRTALRFTEAPSSNRLGGFLGRRNDEPPVFETSGDYTLDFEHGGRVITRLPFRVERIESNDPYADALPRYVLLGPWQTHGFVNYEEGDRGREPHLQWNFYDQLLDPDRTLLDFEQVRWELRRDAQLIARTVTSSNSTDSRSFVTQTFEKVELAAGSSFADSRISRADMADGSYELRRVVRADDFNGGNFTQTITFDVRDGRFVPVGDQVRQGTPPGAFIEGLNRAFFYPITTTR